MNPILISAFFGFLKGFLHNGELHSDARSRWTVNFAGPVVEETVYRALPLYAFGDRLPHGWTALAFAIDHVSGEVERHHYTPARTVGRFADVLFGGIMYERAFRQWGILGAIAAHCLHNMAVGVGNKARMARPQPKTAVYSAEVHK
mgnify:CR=1 FL=1